MTVHPRHTIFDRFARWTEHQLGRSVTFALAASSVVLWGLTGSCVPSAQASSRVRPITSMAAGWQPDAAHRDYLKKIVGTQRRRHALVFFLLAASPGHEAERTDPPSAALSRPPGVFHAQSLGALATELLDAHSDRREIVGSARVGPCFLLWWISLTGSPREHGTAKARARQSCFDPLPQAKRAGRKDLRPARKKAYAVIGRGVRR